MTEVLLRGDDARLDVMINDFGLDQLAASRQLWPATTAPADLGPLATDPPDPRTASPADHSAWVRVWVRDLVRCRLHDIVAWLAGGAA